ncbi:MAG: hypothetical protein IT542_14190 [Rubellimicrobium sp.]|nr:hypothetical protein [Rubellimicrobium sp.]
MAMPDPIEEARPPGGTGLARLAAPRRAEPHLQPGDIVAAVVALIWLALVAGFFLFATPGESGAGSFGTIMVLVAIFLPLALIWVVAATARATRAIRAEAERLQSTIDAMRQAMVAQSAMNRPTVEKKLEEIATAARQAESAIATFTSRRDGEGAVAERKPALPAARPAAPAEEQPALALGTPAEALAPPVSVEDLVRALNFPDSADDKDGIRALRAALEDRSLAKLIRAAQDVLTLLGQDGIYMDDLRPDRAKPDLWRRFASGERGKTIAALGGVRDRSSLALTAGRMRQDTIFRDAAHHFLRQFDKTVAAFEANASDQQLVALAETRTARAFMLLARVTGTFD